ncbi:MAG: response regulator [Bacteroidota bacterium]
MKKILYVDDEEFNRYVFNEEFSDKFIVFSVSSGKNALELLQHESVDIVVTDMKMPIMSGLELIREIRKFNSHIPCVMLSALFHNKMIREDIRSGVITKCIEKPWDTEELVELLGDLISKR